jgi:hypothetical protein
MRKLAKYLLAGVFAAAVTNTFIAPIYPGLSVAAWTLTRPGTSVQSVDRSRKGDRLDIDMSVIPEQPVDPKPAKMIDGCEPAFSPLAASAHADIAPGRCIA